MEKTKSSQNDANAKAEVKAFAADTWGTFVLSINSSSNYNGNLQPRALRFSTGEIEPARRCSIRVVFTVHASI